MGQVALGELSLAELRALWDSRPAQGERAKDREAFEYWTRVRAEMFRRIDTRPADGQTHGSGKVR